MDTSLLLKALGHIAADFASLKLEKLVRQAAVALEAAAANPADPAQQSQFSQAVAVLRKTLAQAATHHASLSLQSVFLRTGLYSLTGPSLTSKLEEILEAKPFLMQEAAKSMKAWADEVSAASTSAHQTIEYLQRLGLSGVAESPDYQSTVVLPSHFCHDDLRILERQLKGWLRVVDVLAEISTGRRPERIVSTGLSKGSFELSFALDMEGALAMLIFIGGIVKALQVARSARARRDEMEAEGYPTDLLEKMDEHESTLVQKSTDEVVAKVMDLKKDRTEARTNELRTHLGISIDFALRSINRGVNVEVSTPPAGQVKKDADAAVAQIQQKIDQLRIELDRRLKQLPDRTKPILELPDPRVGGDEAQS